MTRWLSLLMLLSVVPVGAAEAHMDGPPVETHETAPPAEMPSAEAEEEGVHVARAARSGADGAADARSGAPTVAHVHSVPPVPPPR